MILGIHPSYWQSSIFRVVGVLVAVLLPAGTFVYVYLFKMVSFMQSRLGPMEAGPGGSMQLFAEVAKFLQKEDLIPDRADKRIFAWAPIVVLVSTFLLFVVVPFGPDAILSGGEGGITTGIFIALALSSISVLGILMAGWSSANKYSLMGGLRAAGQLIAYELPMVLSVLGVVIQAGTLDMNKIVVAQNSGSIFGLNIIGNPYVLTQFVGFMIFMISIQAELTQTPFDMPVAESELVAGYMTEYSGFRFLTFFIAEFATAGAFAAIASTLFLGGWGLPHAWFGWATSGDLVANLNSVGSWMNVVGPLILFGKVMLLGFIIFWVRFTYPRFREDQLQRFAWKVLIPLSLANIAVTAILKVVF
jgi:NADH-quinone oxidoreductase subunit H